MSNNTNGPWTVDVTETVKLLFAAGKMSCSEIAAEVYKKHHVFVSRNAVIGKLHRLGLARPKFIHTKKAERPARTQVGPLVQKINATRGRITPEPFVCQDASEIAPLHLSIQELTDDTCKWPHGDLLFTFCGHATAAGKVYCQAHCAIAYVKPERKVYIRPRESLEAKAARFGGGRAA